MDESATTQGAEPQKPRMTRNVTKGAIKCRGTTQLSRLAICLPIAFCFSSDDVWLQITASRRGQGREESSGTPRQCAIIPGHIGLGAKLSEPCGLCG